MPAQQQSRAEDCPLDGPIPTEPPRRRLETVDVLRGLLMVIMALDHTREYLSDARIDPTNPILSWPALFATRWVTHLCAPGFVALAGTAVYLQRQRGKTRPQITRFLLTRGLWLIFLDVTLVSFGLTFSALPIFEVIWAIGASMIVLSALLWAPATVIGLFGAAVVVLHNLLDPIQAQSFGAGYNLWMLLHQPGPLHLPGRLAAIVGYPLIPWCGVMALGYWFGEVTTLSAWRRPRLCALLGAMSLVAFAALRLSGAYGDPNHLQHLSTFSHTAMSFLAVNKYPPSLQFLLATQGVLLLLFALIDWIVDKGLLTTARGPLEIFGRVPFFYFVVHIYLIHTVAVLWWLASPSGGIRRLSSATLAGPPPGFGYGLPVIYAVWIAVVAAMYLPSRWFSRIKARRRNWWLSYL